MKKSLYLALSFSLLAGCSSETATPEIVQPPSQGVEETPQIELPPVENTEENTEETTTEDIVLPENPISSAYALAITEARDEESNLYNPILSSTADEFSEYIFPLLQFEPETAQGYAISVSAMMVQAYGIAAILPVEGQEEKILEGLQFFMDTQVQNFTGYLPDQLEIAKAARLETLENGTILMVMCADQDSIFDNIASNDKISPE